MSLFHSNQNNTYFEAEGLITQSNEDGEVVDTISVPTMFIGIDMVQDMYKKHGDHPMLYTIAPRFDNLHTDYLDKCLALPAAAGVCRNKGGRFDS